jgi:hypothetical protein
VDLELIESEYGVLNSREEIKVQGLSQWLDQFPENAGLTLMNPEMLWQTFGPDSANPDLKRPELKLDNSDTPNVVGFILPHNWEQVQVRNQLGSPNDALAQSIKEAKENKTNEIKDTIWATAISFMVNDPVDGERYVKSGLLVDLSGGLIKHIPPRSVAKVVADKPPKQIIILETQKDWWEELKKAADWAAMQTLGEEWFAKKVQETLNNDPRRTPVSQAPEPNRVIPKITRSRFEHDFAFSWVEASVEDAAILREKSHTFMCKAKLFAESSKGKGNNDEKEVLDLDVQGQQCEDLVIPGDANWMRATMVLKKLGEDGRGLTGPRYKLSMRYLVSARV